MKYLLQKNESHITERINEFCGAQGPSVVQKSFCLGLESIKGTYKSLLPTKEDDTINLLDNYLKLDLMNCFLETSTLNKGFSEMKSWRRVIRPLMNDAYQYGRSLGIQELTGSKNPEVFKLFKGSVSKLEKSLYFDAKGYPKVFGLQTLLRNGINNRGREKRATELLPVVGSTHAWCSGVLHCKESFL